MQHMVTPELLKRIIWSESERVSPIAMCAAMCVKAGNILGAGRLYTAHIAALSDEMKQMEQKNKMRIRYKIYITVMLIEILLLLGGEDR